MSTILIISPEPWDGHSVSKHHYAWELVRRGHQVVFYGPPEGGRLLRLKPVANSSGRLQVLNAPKVALGLRFAQGTVRRFLEARWLSTLENVLGSRIDVVWNFENSRFFDMRFAGERLKIYQQVDLNQNFNPEIAASTADLTIALSSPIENRLAASARKLIHITHGHSERRANFPLPDGFDQCFGSKCVNAVLIGNLDIVYLDVALLSQLVKTHTGVCFHFVGGYTFGKGLHGATHSARNAVFWGRQAAEFIPAFLAKADVLLVAYLAHAHLDQLANPHKMMEYIASGRCVLATRTLEYEYRPDLIEMAHCRAEYASRFADIVMNPAAFNRPDQIETRQTFARDNTYPRQLDRIVNALGPRGHLIS